MDKIAVYGSDYRLTPGALTADHFVVGVAATANTGQFVYNTTDHTLSWDADGTGSAAAVTLAVIANGAPVHATDFLIL
jgi:hypothetical protein